MHLVAGAVVVLIFALIPKTYSSTTYPKPISDYATQLFEPVASSQFIFILKTRGNPSVETASQRLAAVAWKSHSPLVLLNELPKLQRFFSLRHGKSCFIQVLLTEESANDIVRTNPLQLNRAERMHFNENVGLYSDIFIVFNVATPKSRWVLVGTNTAQYCVIPSKYYMPQLSRDAEHVTGGIRIEPLKTTFYWVNLHVHDLWNSQARKHNLNLYQF